MQKEEIERWLAAFDRSPAAAMDRLPPKRTPAGAPVRVPLTRFTREAIASGDYVLERDQVRSALDALGEDGTVITVADVAAGKAPIKAHDRAEDLVDVLRYEKPDDMDAANLGRAALVETPWSDDYWAVYHGILGHRYADADFPDESWKKNFAYVKRRPAAKAVASGDQEAIDALSPSEKYDLLVGDTAGTLTAAMWAEGQALMDKTGRVETWMGICHGWAPASYMLARPRRTVSLKSPDGVLIRFFPSDVKALASLLWANASPPVRFIGTRCDEKHPKRDRNGRVLSDAAFDDNPGTWHLAVVNQIGVAKRAFVMDSTYDYEVWNQPVTGYEYRYFNPQTMRFAPTRREGTVARGDFTRDRFSKYRSADYDAALGVAMRTTYVAETPPSHEETDGPGSDRIVLVDYFYDLELDGAGRILGGEWYVNRHPDFLYSPSPGARAVTPGDAFATGAWPEGQPVPESWRSAAVRTSADGLPLAKIVERLIALTS